MPKIIFNLLFFITFIGCSQLEGIKTKILPTPKQEEVLKTVWVKNLDSSYLSGNVPIHFNGPLANDGAIFIGSSKEGFLSIDEKSGKILWKKQEKETYTSSPVVFENNIIYGTENGRVFSRKLINGELNYEIDLGASVDGTPIVSSGRLFVQLRNHQIFSLDAETGKIIWSYKKPVTNLTTIQGVGKGFVLDQKVIFGFADGDLMAFRVETGDVVWERKIASGADKFMDLNWDIIEYQGDLATLDATGTIHLVSSSDGNISHQFNVGASTNLLKINEDIYFGSQNGTVQKLDEHLSFNTVFKASKSTLTRISFWKNRLIVGDINGLVNIYSFDEHKIIKNKLLGNELSTLFTSPSNGQLGGVLFFSSRGRLYYYQ